MYYNPWLYYGGYPIRYPHYALYYRRNVGYGFQGRRRRVPEPIPFAGVQVPSVGVITLGIPV